MAAFPDIPGYEIHSELGRGGMAVVYSAIEKDLDRPVAIKVVQNVDGDAEGHIQRLENEARGLAALHHPHIVDLYRFGRTADGSLYYVMPLLSGGTLEDWPKPVPEEKVVELLENLLDALEHAHAADIIHRDIKPPNILFDRFKRPMLADFGAAFMRQRATRLTSHGGAIGSSGYMSPEQARGHEVDARSDLYSTAVLAFELLTGERPFEGPDGLAVALAQLEKPVPRLPEPLKHWQAFFDKALAVNPAVRHPDAKAMREAMRNLRHAPSGVSKRSLAIALAAVVVLLLGGLSFAAWKSRHATAVAAPVAVAAPKLGNTASPAAREPAKVATIAPPASLSTPADVAADKPAEPEKKPAAVGDRFNDAKGPQMVVARLPTHSRPGLAVMAAAVDTSLYAQFAKAQGRKGLHCEAGPAPAQGCLDLAMSKDVARWLSRETGHRYRVPSRAELGASIARVANAKAYAWTDTCHEVRVEQPRNVAQRSWSRLRRLVGKPKPAPYEMRCDGYFGLKLDGQGRVAEVQSQATANTVAVLVREF